MAKADYIPTLFLIFNTDPKMAGHDGLVWAYGKPAEFKLLLASVQHAWVNKANVGDASKFFLVIIHCLLDLYT